MILSCGLTFHPSIISPRKNSRDINTTIIIMGCITSNSANADGVIENDRNRRRPNRHVLTLDEHIGFDSPRFNGNATTETSGNRGRTGSDPLYFSPNQAQFRFEFDEDFQSGPHRLPHQMVSTTGSNSALVDQRRNTRLTILNMPSRTRARRTTRGLGEADPDSSDAAVLEQLQLDLVTIERIFQSLLGGPYQGSGNGSTADIQVLTANDSCPPASQIAIDTLPSIHIAEEDLEDENNRSCCICFGDHNLNEKVARLPCGHLFHHACVSEWLHKHCTCPFCRWELATDNIHFEEGRLERMRSRRVRLRPHEMERMSLEELKDLALTRLEDDGENNKLFVQKASRFELIEKILRSKKVDIIVSSEGTKKSEETIDKKTCHNIDELRSMDIEGLKKILNESGISCSGVTDDDKDNDCNKEKMIELVVKSAKVLQSNSTDSDLKISNVEEIVEDQKEEIVNMESVELD